MKKLLLSLIILLGFAATIIFLPYADSFYKSSTINSIPVITNELSLRGQLITYPFISKDSKHSDDLKYTFKDNQWIPLTLLEKQSLLELFSTFNNPVFKSPHGKYEFDYSKGMYVRDVNSNQTIKVNNPLGYELRPVTWSPNDRYFIYETSVPLDPLDFEYLLMMLDVETGKSYRLQKEAFLRQLDLIWLK